MSAIYPLTLIFVTVGVWIYTAHQNARLVQVFWQRLPLVAQRELPGTLDRHPEKTFFFFRRRAVEVFQGDDLLWRLRKRFLVWVVLSLAIPVLGFLSIGVVALFVSQR